MVKKLVLCLILSFTMVSTACAAQRGIETVLDAEVFDSDIVTASPDGIYIGDKDKVSFIFDYDIHDTTGDNTATAVFEVSVDNSTWIDFDLIDAGGTTATSILQFGGADREDVVNIWGTWPYIRLLFGYGQSSAASSATVSCYMIWQK